MNILLVDDEVITIKGMMDGINWKKCGIDGKVFVAYNSVEALDIIHNNKVDLILCDIEMPGENGIELLKKIYEIDSTIKVIFLTCHAKFEYAREALRLGCKDYILKPAPYDQVEKTVLKVVNEINRDRKEQEMIGYGEHWLKEKVEKTEAMQGGEKKSTSEVVEEIASYIVNHLDDTELTIANLAKKWYLSEDYMNRVFKKTKQISINQFIIQERMKLAAHLLENESLTINTIASEAGYENYPYFSSTFKRYYGCNPTQYRIQKLGKQSDENDEKQER